MKSSAQDIKTMAILPFETISSDNIVYLQTGILKMLHSRLAWKGHVNVVPDNIVEKHLKTIGSTDMNTRIKTLSKLTGSDYVLTGSITQFSDAFSIDTRIYDIQNKRFMIFSEQSKIISDLIPKVNYITAKINKQVFDRETMIYNQLVNKEKEKYEQLRRQNPEKMMPTIPSQGPAKQSFGWRFWEYL